MSLSVSVVTPRLVCDNQTTRHPDSWGHRPEISIDNYLGLLWASSALRSQLQVLFFKSWAF